MIPSTAVSEGYIEHSINNKMGISNKISNCQTSFKEPIENISLSDRQYLASVSSTGLTIQFSEVLKILLIFLAVKKKMLTVI